MDIGIGVPSTIPGHTGEQTIAWARRAEESGFASVGVLDRLVYDNSDPLLTLAAAAAVTDRVRLVTTVLVAPYRASGALLAKQAMTLDQLSGGRLTLGLAVGGRRDDFDVAGTPFEGRGARLDAMVEEMLGVWSGELDGASRPIGPALHRDRIPLLFGGRADEALKRMALKGDGWVGASPHAELFGPMADRARAAWTEHGRPGAPHLTTIGYFALGADGARIAEKYLTDYYAFLGAQANFITSGALTSASAVKGAVAGLAETGCDELILHPCSPEVEQVDMLAEALA